MSELSLLARQIKQRVSVAEAAEWFGYDYHNQGRHECPKCSELSSSKKTLAIYDEERWYCFHCSDGGDVIDWLAACQQCEKWQAIKQIASRLGLTGDISGLVDYLKHKLSEGDKFVLAGIAEQEKAIRAIRRKFWAYHAKSTLVSDKEYIRRVQDFLDIEKEIRLVGVHDHAYKKSLHTCDRMIDGRDGGSDIINTARQFKILKTIVGYCAIHCADATIDRFGQKMCDRFQLGNWDRKRFPSISDEQLESCGLLSKSGKPLLRGRMIFPIQDLRGRFVGLSGRRISDDDGPKYINAMDNPIFRKRQTLYGLYDAAPYILKHGFAIITEGYGAKIAMANTGIHNVVATMGTSMTEEHAELLSRFTKRVVTMFDGDDAGRKASARADLICKTARIDTASVWLPSGMDPEDYLKVNPSLKLVKKVKKAVSGFSDAPIDRLGLGQFRRRVRISSRN